MTGVVDSGQEKAVASHLAVGVPGVAGIRDHLTVTPVRARTDPEIVNDVQSRLRWSLPLDARFVTVTSAEGIVVLGGRVATPADRERAATLAWVRGVRSVDAATLAIDPAAFPGEPRPPAVPGADDPSIATAVRDALFYDPRVLPTEVAVQVQRAVVTLRGDPSTVLEKRAAVEDARDTIGVRGVDDQMRVTPESWMSDHEIARRVRVALRRDPIVDVRGLSVAAVDGEALIRGRVSGKLAHARAIEVASAVPGVRNVDDGIIIVGRPRERRLGRRHP